MIYLHKLLPLVASPIGLIIGLMLLALVLRRQWPVYWALFILLVCSFPLTARFIWVGLESEYQYQAPTTVPKADAVLVLSGMLGGFESEDGYVTEWGDPDRFFVGLQLVKMGKADRLIFTRGKMPWSESPPEGELLKQKALEMGIFPEQILLTSIVSNTAEESVAVKDLMAERQLKKIILVTSSFHMPRAKLLFDQVGVETYPYPTDFKAASRNMTWLHFIPSADALRNTYSGIREYLGRIYYRLKYA